MSDDGIHWATLATLRHRLGGGELTSLELTKHLLARIAEVDDRVGSFIHVADDALSQARASDRRRRRGSARPLEGIPIALKDNYLSAGMPTTAGTRAEGITFPEHESACAERLRAAGCVLIGKTRTHEFAWGTVTPPTANPWNLDCIPGGSSGGSGAAVAAGLVPMGMGSDTGGSIRIPASFCGVVGLKPTFGRVSRHGIVPHSWSLDHPGPLTRSVEDAALVMNVLAGYDPRDPACQDRAVPDHTSGLGHGVRGLRIGVIENHFMDRNTDAVQACIDGQIARLGRDGARIVRCRMPLLEYGLGAIFAIELASSGAFHDRWIAEGRSAAYQRDVRDLVEMGRFVTAVDYLKAEQVRTLMCEAFRRLFDDVDVIVTPTEPLTAWRSGHDSVSIGGREESVLAASWRLTYPFNLTGLPAISVPCGFDGAGMPIGLQIAGRPFDEATVLRCAAHIERSVSLTARPAIEARAATARA
jgi:aspartyl-tRNA(Asn)/glutamyl-tRNA(Gln) amidotransferase subunit A